MTFYYSFYQSINQRCGVQDKLIQPALLHHLKGYRYAACLKDLYLLIKFGIALITADLQVAQNKYP